MHVFVDTSALAKRYIKEPGSAKFADILEEATTVFASVLTLPEVCSALNRLRREKLIKPSQYKQIKEAVMKDFHDFSVCELTPDVIATSINLLEQYPLKSFDALQIACALEIDVGTFVTADRQQQKAAKGAGLTVLAL